MIIRRATTEDLPVMTEIFSGARRFMAEHGNSAQWSDGYPREELLREDIKQERSYVCEEKGHIYACFVFLREPDPNYAYIEGGAWKNDRPYATLHRVASTGEKSGMVDFIVRWAWKEIPNLRGDTHELNLPMQKAFERNGFERCGIVYMRDNGTPRIAYQKER